ncbi:MAG: VOC family protein [Bacteroidota bacterium]
MKINGLLETAIYGKDLNSLEKFYTEIFGLELVAKTEGRNVVLKCGNSALILFNPEASLEPGGIFPPHGNSGNGHVAFVVEENELSDWRAKLESNSIEIEAEVNWHEGGTSIYFRDTAGNSIELAPTTLWKGLGRLLLNSNK